MSNGREGSAKAMDCRIALSSPAAKPACSGAKPKQPTKRSRLTQYTFVASRSPTSKRESRAATSPVRSPFSTAKPLETSAASVNAPITSARRIRRLLLALA